MRFACDYIPYSVWRRAKPNKNTFLPYNRFSVVFVGRGTRVVCMCVCVCVCGGPLVIIILMYYEVIYKTWRSFGLSRAQVTARHKSLICKVI